MVENPKIRPQYLPRIPRGTTVHDWKGPTDEWRQSEVEGNTPEVSHKPQQ